MLRIRNLFSKRPSAKKQAIDKAFAAGADDILGTLPRGEEGRPHSRNFQVHSYFENPQVLVRDHIYHEGSGDDFLGIIGGTSKLIVRKDGRKEYVTTGGSPIGIRDDRHRTLIAGSRSGKGRSVLIPSLLTSAASCICIDPKAENAAITARYRAEVLGHKVFILDPFRIAPPHCEPYRAQYNPMRTIRLDSLTMVEDAALIADALVVSTNTKDAHWDETAKAFIESVLLFVTIDDFPPKKKHLPRSRSSSPANIMTPSMIYSMK